MSPASQGGVEVERYIGSCLISSTVRPGSHKPIAGRKQEPVIRGKTRGCYGSQNFPNGTEQCQVQYGPGGWTGAPLISMTSSPRRCNQRSSPSLGQQQQQQQSPPSLSQQQQQQACDQQVSVHLHKNPLSRLAIHTQGAPLILANRFHNRGKIHNSGNVNGIANAVCNNTGVVNSYVHNNASAVTSNCTMNNNTVRCPPSRPQRPIEMAKKQQQQQASKPTDCTATKETTGTTGNNSIANIDSLSIASDESSGSNNSENSLPRIIKPRKRRKKDRKPPNNAVTSVTEATKLEEQQQQSNLSSNAIIEQSNSLKPYVVPGCYEQRCYEAAPPQLRNHRRPPIARESALYGCRAQTTGMSVQEIADARQRYPHRHVEVKVLDDNRNVVVPAQMRTIPPKGYRHNGHHHHHHHNHHHGSNNVPRYLHEYNEPTTSTTATTTTTTTSSTTGGCEDGINDELGPCQCRYCDPSALIWDVDQNCYSPFLTPSPSNEFCPGHFAQMPPLFLSRPSLDCQEQSIERLFNGDNPRSHREKDGTGVVLRRSWSDPTSYFSEEISAPSKDVGVIGDRGQAESGKRRTLWRGDSIGIPVNNVGSSAVDANGTVQSPKGLEVSTEIITSPNGHRDLEIKFYSPLPNAPLPEEEKVAGVLAEEVDEDEEDFSDIWSYHESKLQQDFRTLLQAEE